MKVKIKSFDVQMELKNKGVELEIRDTSDNFLGDLVITRTKLIWCRGRTDRANGVNIRLKDFVELMESR